MDEPLPGPGSGNGVWDRGLIVNGHGGSFSNDESVLQPDCES